MIRIVGKSHQGKRAYNEDFVIADASQGLAIVTDGMGGRSAGEVASEIAACAIREHLANGGNLVDAILAAHREVIAAAHDGRGKPGMATTVAAVQMQGAAFMISWVGDSRVYLWNGELMQLTRDHSYVQALIAQGKLAMEDADKSTKRNLVTQALGIEQLKSLDIKVIRGELGRGEQLLICSDGLHDELGNVGIAKILSEGRLLEDTVDELVMRAVVAGGSDNISVVLVDPGSTAGTASKPPSVVSRVDREGQETFIPPESAVELSTEILSEKVDACRSQIDRSPRVFQTRYAVWTTAALTVMAIVLARYFF